MTHIKFGVDDGARTHDDRNHNPGLYQLSYAHHFQLSTVTTKANRDCNAGGLYSQVKWYARQESNL